MSAIDSSDVKWLGIWALITFTFYLIIQYLISPYFITSTDLKTLIGQPVINAFISLTIAGLITLKIKASVNHPF